MSVQDVNNTNEKFTNDEFLFLIVMHFGKIDWIYVIVQPDVLKLSLVFLLISYLTNGLRLHQFLGTKTTEANKSLKTDANGAH